MSLEIKKVDTAKHKIKQRPLMEQLIVPGHPTIILISSSAGAGKSTLVANMLTNPLYYGAEEGGKPYFDSIFLFIGSSDDMYDHLIDDGVIKQNHISHPPTADNLEKLLTEQKKIIDNKGILKAPKLLLIFDDIIHDGAFVRSKPFLECFIKNRHMGATVILISQYLNLIPRPIRLQATWTICFKVNRAENETLTNQYCPATVTKKEFSQMVQEATMDAGDKKNNFLVICKKAPEDKRFRKNFDSIINLKRLKYIPTFDKLTPKEMADREYDTQQTLDELKEEMLRLPELKQPQASKMEKEFSADVGAPSAAPIARSRSFGTFSKHRLQK